MRAYLSNAMSKFPHIQLRLLIELPEFLLQNRRDQLDMRYLQHPHRIILYTSSNLQYLQWCALWTPQGVQPEATARNSRKHPMPKESKRPDLPRVQTYIAHISPVASCTHTRYMEESMASPMPPSPAAARGTGPPRPLSLDQGLWNSQGPRLCHLG